MNDLVFPSEYFYDEVRDGFYVPEMMKRYWAAQLEVLREIDRICQRHDLIWFGNYGTMLGAIRHKGYIPWDDDIDITMLRDDYDRFFEAAKTELPEGYVIMTTEEQEEYAYPFGRITNSHNIDMNAGFLKKFHGCPYVVGVDIYPYDKIFNDSKIEEERDRRGTEVFNALRMLNTAGFDKKELNRQLRLIEEQNHVRIDRTRHLGNQLNRILESICTEARDEDAEEFYLLYSWILYRDTKFPVDYFNSFIKAPFETATITIPAKYDEMLRAFYSDYMKKVRSGGLHEYPVYKRQEDIFKTEKGEPPFRYTLTPEKISLERKYPGTREKCKNILSLLRAANQKLPLLNQPIMEADFISVLQSCQNAAVSLGTILENKFGDKAGETVSVLENYCEDIYNLSIEMSEEGISALNTELNLAEKKLSRLFEDSGKDILFLPCRAVWWDTMKPVFEAAASNTRNTISIIPIPHFDCDFMGNVGDVHVNADDFATVSGIQEYLTSFDEYGLEKRHPDIIIIQVPFDSWNCAFTIPEPLFSENLLKFTDELAYVPCFDTIVPESDNDKIIATLRILIEQPAVVNADRIILKHERIKEIYLNTLVSLTSPEYKEYWEEKLCLISETEWCKP